MKLIISDFDSSILNIDGEHQVIENNGKIRNCIGCFGCWIKTPGKCIIPDSYNDIGEKLGHCTELIIISECVYGSTSPFVKMLWIDPFHIFIHFFVYAIMKCIIKEDMITK